MFAVSSKKMRLLETTDEIDDWVASLFPVDLETVAVLVVVIEILDVFENLQVGLGEGGTPRRHLLVGDGFVVTAHRVRQLQDVLFGRQN